jgi:hypothetical protein
MGVSTIHGKEAILNKDKLKNILDRRGLEFADLHYDISEAYGLDLSYKGFMSLVQNRSAWKLLYAWAIADYLDIEIKDIFEIVDIDVKKKKKEKEEWKEKYQHNK